MVEDLDLDELDQAVNNMMSKPRGKRAAKKAAPSPAEPIAVRPEPLANKPEPVQVSTPRPEPVKAGPTAEEDVPAPREAEPMRVTVNRPMPRVPERRRMHPGAMDIIQPNPLPKIKAPSSRPGRLAAALHPTQNVQPEPRLATPTPASQPPQPEPVVSLPEPTRERPLDTPQDVSDEVLASLSLLDEKKPEQNLFAAEQKTANSVRDQMVAPQDTPAPIEKKPSDGWPDPLDFHDFNDKPAEKPELNAPATPEAPVTEAAEPEAPKETPPSLATDPVSVTDRHEDAAVSSSPFVTTKVEKRPLGAFADAAHEPAKLPTPVVPAESADAPVPHESTSKGELAEASLESKQHLDTPQRDNFDPTDLRSMTIPPQYHTAEHKPSDGVRHVFDTKEYHAAPPHMHTAHKSSPALVISVVVLIVLIVAALLVGYFMMTGTFDVTKLW